MKITRANISREYPKINQSILPKTLKKDEFSFLQENLDLYGEDETIDEFIDTFISNLNEIVEATTVVVHAPKKRKTTKKQVGSKTKPTPKTRKKRTPKTKQSKPFVKEVGDVDLQLKLIKSFTLLANKEKTKKQILNLYKRFEKAAVELKVRKTSAHAKNIMYAAEKLKSTYNETRGGLDAVATLSVSPAKLNELKRLAAQERQMDSVRFIKRYVGLIGKPESAGAAERLLNSIEKAIEQGKITKRDLFWDKIEHIREVLDNMVHYSIYEQFTPEEVSLRGLDRIAGVSVKKKSKNLAGLDTFQSTKGRYLPQGVYSANEIANTHFEVLKLTADWGRAIGSVSLPFHLLFWGEKGSGKSTLLFNFAKYLAKSHGLKVVYVAKEEGGSSMTVKEKILRLSADVPNLFFSENIPTDANFMKSVDVLIIDSVNSLALSSGDLEKMKDRYPKLSTVALLMAYKSGDTYKGDSDFGHNAQAVFKVANGKWKAEKNRFGGSEEVEVKF